MGADSTFGFTVMWGQTLPSGGRFTNFSPLFGDRHSTFQLAVLLVNGCNILGRLVCVFVIKRQFLMITFVASVLLSWLGRASEEVK